MALSDLVSVSGSFLQFVGELLADAKRREIAATDVELIGLKRTQLRERLLGDTAQVRTAAAQEKARADQDLISRGLSNTTIRQSRLHAIERDASERIETMTREYNRAMEEFALMERKIEREAKSWWRRGPLKLR